MAKKTKIQKISQRVDKLRSARETTFSYLQEVYDFSMPNRQTFSKSSPGQKKDNQIFDSTAVIATTTYVSRIQTLLVKPWTKWFALEAGSIIPEEDKKGISKELEEVSNAIYNELNYSNFSEQISSSFYDLAASTGAIMVRENTNDNFDSSLLWESIPLADLMLDKAADGTIKTVFRDLSIPIDQVTAKWPKAKLTDDLKAILDQDESEKVDLTEGVIYNEKDNNYNFVLFESADDQKSFLIDETLEESPYIIFREQVIPGETYGRGRLQTVFSDIKSANKVQELALSAASMSIAGVFTAVSDGVFNVNNARFAPGAVIPVTSNGANPTLAPLNNPSDIQVANFELQYLRTNINTVMLTMPLGDINETKGRTATEMSLRQNDFLQTSVAGFNRLQTELLNQIINKTIAVLTKLGKIEPIKINGELIKIKYMSPIASLAGDEKLQKMRMFMEMLQAIPEGVQAATIAYDKFPQKMIEALDLPEEFVRSKAEQDAIVQGQIEQQQQMQQMEMMKQMPNQGQM